MVVSRTAREAYQHAEDDVQPVVDDPVQHGERHGHRLIDTDQAQADEDRHLHRAGAGRGEGEDRGEEREGRQEDDGHRTKRQPEGHGQGVDPECFQRPDAGGQEAAWQEPVKRGKNEELSFFFARRS